MFSLNFELIANDKPFTFDNTKDHTKCKKIERDIISPTMLSEFWENSFFKQLWWACNELLFLEHLHAILSLQDISEEYIFTPSVISKSWASLAHKDSFGCGLSFLRIANEMNSDGMS